MVIFHSYVRLPGRVCCIHVVRSSRSSFLWCHFWDMRGAELIFFHPWISHVAKVMWKVSFIDIQKIPLYHQKYHSSCCWGNNKSLILYRYSWCAGVGVRLSSFCFFLKNYKAHQRQISINSCRCFVSSPWIQPETRDCNANYLAISTALQSNVKLKHPPTKNGAWGRNIEQQILDLPDLPVLIPA